MENIWGIIATLVSGIVGGGLVGNFITLRAQKKKANAEARGSELANVEQALKTWRDNIEPAIKIWKDMATDLSDELKEQQLKTIELREQLEKLTKEVNRLTCINNKILRLLDRITPENLDDTVSKIKEVIN